MVSNLNVQGNLPETDFLTSWLRQQSVNSIPKVYDISDFCRIWHLGGFDSMEKTPTGCGSDLFRIITKSKLP